jgi:hypothetical protein
VRERLVRRRWADRHPRRKWRAGVSAGVFSDGLGKKASNLRIGRSGDPDGASQASPDRFRPFMEASRISEQRDERSTKGEQRRRRPHAPARALEQANAPLALESTDLIPQRGLSDAFVLGCSGERATREHRLEVSELPEFHGE